MEEQQSPATVEPADALPGPEAQDPSSQQQPAETSTSAPKQEVEELADPSLDADAAGKENPTAGVTEVDQEQDAAEATQKASVSQAAASGPSFESSEAEAALHAATRPTSAKGGDPDVLNPLLPGRYPIHVDPTRYELAFGRKGVPKLVEEMNVGSADKDLKNIVILANLIHTPEDAYDAIKSGAIRKICSMLEHRNLTIRQKTTEILSTLASHAQGRFAILSSPLMSKCAVLFQDTDPLVRRHIHTCLVRLTLQRSCVLSILSHGLFLKLVTLLPTERMDIQIPMLQTCQNVIRHGGEGMLGDAMAVGLGTFFTMLKDRGLVTDIKVACANCIMMLTFYLEAKKLAATRENILILTTLLSDPKSQVRAAVLGALMSITVNVDAKKTMGAEKLVPRLMDLLEDSNELVLVNCIKTITNCAENYRSRYQLSDCLDKLKKYSRSRNDQLAHAAETAIRVITWRP